MRSLAAPVFAAALLALAGCQAPTDDAAFGQKVRAYLLEHPEVLEEAIGRLQAKKAAEAEAGAQKLLASNRPALLQDPRDPVIGDPKAPITVVEFFDYRCGFCKTAAPDVLKLVQENRDVRLVMKEMPILSPASERAARVALAAGPAKYVAVHTALMSERALDEAAVDRIARANGIALTGLDAPALTDHLGDVRALATQLSVDGTPAFIVGNRMIAGADIDALRAAIAAERAS